MFGAEGGRAVEFGGGGCHGGRGLRRGVKGIDKMRNVVQKRGLTEGNKKKGVLVTWSVRPRAHLPEGYIPDIPSSLEMMKSGGLASTFSR